MPKKVVKVNVRESSDPIFGVDTQELECLRRLLVAVLDYDRTDDLFGNDWKEVMAIAKEARALRIKKKEKKN